MTYAIFKPFSTTPVKLKNSIDQCSVSSHVSSGTLRITANKLIFHFQDDSEGTFKKLGSSLKTLIRFNTLALTGPPVVANDDKPVEKKSVPFWVPRKKS